jgi:hypothetical protein
MTDSDGRSIKKPPEIGPYVFTVLLAGFGLWCVWDGWFTSDPDMQQHTLFNRVAGVVLLSWSAIDYFRMRRRLALKKEKAKIE